MATSPTPQSSETDPQVPGNYPGTVQNPTQSPAPVNPATDPEVPPLPNDVDPNFITNPEPVNNTIDPEVPPAPPPETLGGKRLDPEPVDDFGGLPNDVDPNFVPLATPVSSAVNPQIPPPQDFGSEASITEFPPTQNFFVDPQVPEPPIVQNYFTDAAPTPVAPTVNSQVPQPTTIVETYFSAAAPVQPTTNSQVPQPPVQNIFTLIASLFSRTPPTVAPAVNPQVAQAIPVPAPATIEPTPIPPVSNPQVAQAIPVPTPSVAVPTPIAPAANPQVPEPPIVQNYFVDEPPIVQNYFVDEPPIVQNYFTDAAPVSPAANPEVPQPVATTTVTTSTTVQTVSPTINPQVPGNFPGTIQNPTQLATPVNPEVNPEVPGNYPGTVQNPTQLATPVIPAEDPEVPQPAAETPGVKRFDPAPVDDFGPLPNDVDPNFISQAAPVNSTVNPEVPQPVDNTQILAKLSRVLESPDTSPPAVNAEVNPGVPQPAVDQNLFVDNPAPVNPFVDEQAPQPELQNEQNLFVGAPIPPPSPSPYEIFIAQEAAATAAAERDALARFNSQFDVVDTQDPQVNQNDAVDIGEFQADPELVALDDTSYSEFYGIDQAVDVGEFQADPELVGTGDTGYSDFFGADAAADIGEFQAEPSIGDGASAGFGDFFGGGGDALGDFIGSLKSSPSPVGNADASAGIIDGLSGAAESAIVNLKTVLSAKQIAANKEKAARDLARQQNIINQQRKQANSGDWRVRLRLAPNADYLYKARGNNGASAAGILQPLAVTDGVIFPYTPQINTSYQAKYNPYELTHSNYKGYFYQGSSVGDITINATFTAQDTQEANYLLAVIHFFRSVTKMFYGQDDAAKRGAPPPLVFLQGLGEYQFNLHPCVVSNFNYILPADVDYIRALSPNNDGTNLSDRRSLQSGVNPFINPSASRLQNAGLPTGGIFSPPPPPTLGTNSPTYVPTKMDIQLTLLAVQTRSQVSNQFSLKNFANGNLIKGGFW